VLASCGQSADTSRSRGASPAGAVRVMEPGSTPPDEDAGATTVDAAVAPDAPVGPVTPSVVIEMPLDGASFPRDAVEHHDWVAAVPIRVQATGVSHVELYADDTYLLGRGDAFPYDLTATLSTEGDRVIVARGTDDAGVELARDQVTIHVLPPTDSSCHAMLDALGLDWAVAGSSPGIDDPVRVQPIIHDVSFRYVDNTSPTAMLMDCPLAPRLAELAELVKPYGIDQIVHIGIYNYRCIGGGDPTTGTCTPSQHAYARAIDLHAFHVAATGAEYNVETDWLITTGAVCPGAATGEADRVLHEIACALWSDRIFQIVLTPNYNADHRNHFHVDLTSGSMFIGETVTGVDPIVPGLGD